MNCIYCGKPAGWFHRSHAECREQHEAARRQILHFFETYFQTDMPAEQLGQRARELAAHNFVTNYELHSLAVAGFRAAVNTVPTDQLFSKDKEAKLTCFQNEFTLTQAELDDWIEARHEAGRRQILDLFKSYLQTDMPAEQLGQRARELADHVSMSSYEFHSLTIAGFRAAVNTVLEDQLPSKEEEGKLVRFQNEFALTQADLNGSAERLAKAVILRDLDAGIIKSHIEVEGRLSINLLKSEVVLWLFNDTELYEIKSHKSYIGRSQGVSIRIARGVYYRVGAFKGEPVQTQDLVRQDVGSLIVTNRNVYFSGPIKSMRIRLEKIVSVQGYSDGIGLTRESVNPKPLIFKLDDPWFASNLILKVGAI